MTGISPANKNSAYKKPQHSSSAGLGLGLSMSLVKLARVCAVYVNSILIGWKMMGSAYAQRLASNDKLASSLQSLRQHSTADTS